MVARPEPERPYSLIEFCDWDEPPTVKWNIVDHFETCALMDKLAACKAKWETIKQQIVFDEEGFHHA